MNISAKDPVIFPSPAFPRLLFLVAGAILLAASAGAAQEFAIQFEYPSFRGDFYLGGTVSFPPGNVRTEDQIAVFSATPPGEVPSKIEAVTRWPDGAILKASVLFPANEARPTAYTLRFGEDVRRRSVISEAAVLPAVSFAVGGAARAVEAMDVNVGQINVRVDRSSSLFYYWHALPIALVLALTWWRARRTRQPA